MFRRIPLIALAYLVVALPMVAQRGHQTSQNVIEINIHVTYENDHPAGQMLRVELMNESNIPIQQLFTNTEGQTSFRIAGEGVYHVRVTGQDIQETVSESITIQPYDRSRILFVRVKQTAAAAEQTNNPPGKMTSAAELRIPQQARKLFDKGTEAWNKKDYAKALDFYQQAVATYPNYDAAYNNIGTVYMKLGEPDKALTAFQSAVTMNDKNADADRNLARLLLRMGDYAKAEDAAKKSLLVDPADPGGLLLLEISEFKTGDFAGAVQTGQKVHQAPHEGFASCHYVAGQALEHMNELPKARTEYQLYLQEAPNGAEAATVRASLSRIDDQTANAQ